MLKLRRQLGQGGLHLVLILFGLFNLYPLYYMLVSSLKTNREWWANPFGFPHHAVLGNFHALIFEKGFLRLFLNSGILTICATTVALLLASLAAYGFARTRFYGQDVLFTIVSGLMAIPPIVVITPLYVLMVKAHLINQYPSAIIVYIGFILPFTIFFLTGFFETVPQEIVDAARVDGCNHLRIFFSIFLPLSKAPLTTMALVNGVWVWNELLIGMLFLQSDSKRTLMAGLALFSGRNVNDIPPLMTGLVIATLPLIPIFLAGQRHFAKGLTAGSVK
jgi:raffinose/stachyose/melibiose transport system permease protein